MTQFAQEDMASDHKTQSRAEQRLQALQESAVKDCRAGAARGASGACDGPVMGTMGVKWFN